MDLAYNDLHPIDIESRTAEIVKKIFQSLCIMKLFSMSGFGCCIWSLALVFGHIKFFPNRSREKQNLHWNHRFQSSCHSGLYSAFSYKWMTKVSKTIFLIHFSFWHWIHSCGIIATQLLTDFREKNTDEFSSSSIQNTIYHLLSTIKQ